MVRFQSFPDFPERQQRERDEESHHATGDKDVEYC
jgi:hypothetical protein